MTDGEVVIEYSIHDVVATHLALYMTIHHIVPVSGSVLELSDKILFDLRARDPEYNAKFSEEVPEIKPLADRLLMEFFMRNGRSEEDAKKKLDEFNTWVDEQVMKPFQYTKYSDYIMEGDIPNGEEGNPVPEG